MIEAIALWLGRCAMRLVVLFFGGLESTLRVLSCFRRKRPRTSFNRWGRDAPTRFPPEGAAVPDIGVCSP